MIPMGVEDGVPMEHLISCVPGVEIVMSKKGVKVIHFQENKDPPGAGTFKNNVCWGFFLCACVYMGGGGGGGLFSFHIDVVFAYLVFYQQIVAMGHFLLSTVEHFFIFFFFFPQRQSAAGRVPCCPSRWRCWVVRSETCCASHEPAPSQPPSSSLHTITTLDGSAAWLIMATPSWPSCLRLCPMFYRCVWACMHVWCSSCCFLCVGGCQFLCVHFCIFFSKFQISPMTESDHFLCGKSAVTGHLAQPVGAFFAEFCQDSVFHLHWFVMCKWH